MIIGKIATNINGKNVMKVTQNDYCNPRCTCEPRVNEGENNLNKELLKHSAS